MSSFLRAINDRLSNDSISGVLRTINSRHANIHRGVMFSADFSVADASPLADDASMDVLISVPAGTFPHLLWGSWCEGLSQHYFYENPTLGTSGEGTPITPVNQNRNSSNTANVQVFSGPDIGDPGTPLVNGKWQGNSAGTGSPTAGNIAATGFSRREFDLKPENTYLIRVTARDATLRAGAEAVWYE